MRRLVALLILSTLTFVGATYRFPHPSPATLAIIKSEPVAVVELFTSQGCSSCPPADRLLGTLVDQAEREDQPVYALSFHVAYWNYLGWRDPFSREAFTDRQRRYAQALNESVYTPQMIVNGTSVFVGSKSATADAKIRQALKQEATHAVQLTAEVTDRTVRVRFAVEGPTAGQVLQLALVERDLSVEVKRGENGGRTLHHDNVVRQFKTIALDSQSAGDATITLPEEMNLDKASLIAYVQHTDSFAISGASRVGLPTQ